MKILLLEDELMLNSAISEYLKSIGHMVESFFDGAEVLKSIENGYDLLILDVNVPNIDGFSILNELNNRKIHIPTIFISAQIDIEDITRAYNLGAREYLKKPFHLGELGIKINQILKKSKQNVHLLHNLVLARVSDAHKQRSRLRTGSRPDPRTRPAARPQQPGRRPLDPRPAGAGHRPAPHDGAPPARNPDRRRLCAAQRIRRPLLPGAARPLAGRRLSRRRLDLLHRGPGPQRTAAIRGVALRPHHAAGRQHGDPRIDPPLQPAVLSPGDGRAIPADAADRRRTGFLRQQPGRAARTDPRTHPRRRRHRAGPPGRRRPLCHQDRRPHPRKRLRQQRRRMDIPAQDRGPGPAHPVQEPARGRR